VGEVRKQEVIKQGEEAGGREQEVSDQMEVEVRDQMEV
jgi:hypothetical protein